MFGNMIRKSNKQFAQNITRDPNYRKRNIASSVLVLSSQSVMQAKVETGIDLNNVDDRNRFFAESLVMMVVVIDSNYNTVTMYFNGMDSVGTYTFEAFKNASKKGDSAMDIITVLAALGKGNAPRF